MHLQARLNLIIQTPSLFLKLDSPIIVNICLLNHFLNISITHFSCSHHDPPELLDSNSAITVEIVACQQSFTYSFISI